MMARTRFSNAETRTVLGLARALAEPLPEPADAVAARRWLRDVGPERAEDALLLHGVRSEARDADETEDARLAEQARAVREAMERGDPVTIGDLAVDGNDLKELGLQPGPDLGRVLEACLDAVIADPALNQRKALLEYARSLHDEG